MSDQYTPELGQAVFGCPTSEYGCPDEWADLLYALGELVKPLTDEEYPANPASNTGAHFTNDLFEMHAYWWGDEEAPEAYRPNFRCGELEVRWYKYVGRGMSTNNPEADFRAVFEKCVASLGGSHD